MTSVNLSSVVAKHAVFIRNSLFVFLLLIEISALTIRFDTGVFEKIDLPLLNLFGYSGEFLRCSFAIVGAFIVLSSTRFRGVLTLFKQTSMNPNWKVWALVHMLFIYGLYGLSTLIFEDISQGLISDVVIINTIMVAWIITAAISLFFWFLIIAPWPCWSSFVRQEYRILLISIVTGLLVWGTGQLSAMAWQPLADLTFKAVFHLLNILYSDVVFDVSTKMLGTPAFKVIIASQCSGYEGIALVIIFLSAYLWVARHTLRFPRVYLLFPIGIGAIWILNIIRIAVLIAIGSSWSEEIAVGGFHSNAGWIAFIFISVSLVLICQHIDFFNIVANGDKNTGDTNDTGATALLLPFVVMLATVLLASLFSINFDWLYPLKVIFTSYVLWLFRHSYQPYIKKITASSVLIGIAVFIIWVILVPEVGEVNKSFSEALFNSTPYVAYGWLIFRIIGASIIVPIAEELVFRGYLIAKLVDKQFETVKAGQFTWLSFLGSSIVFGVMHGDWVAGGIAGMCFAFALYQRGELFDAIIAHMTANIFLAAYVLSTQAWSLW